MVKSMKYFFSKIKQIETRFLTYLSVRTLLEVVEIWLAISMIGILISALEKGNYQYCYGVISLFALLKFLILCGKNYCNVFIRIASNKIENEMNVDIYKYMLHQDYEIQQREETKKCYEFSKVAINEIGVEKISNLIAWSVSSLINVLIAAITLAFFNIWLILVVVIVACITFGGELYKAKCQYEVNQKKASLEWNMYYVRDYLSTSNFAKEIRVFGMREYILNKLRYYIDCYTKVCVDGEIKYLKRYGFSYILDGVMLLIIYIYGIYTYISSHIEISVLAVYFSTMTMLSFRVVDFVRNMTTFSEIVPYFESKITLDDLEIQDVEFQNVSFHYTDSQTNILNNVSFHIHKGEKIAIVGRNGAGKTTLICLLLRILKPTSGRILINGLDYLEYSDDTLNKMFSVVLQDFGMYPLSVYENIGMSRNVDILRADACLNEMGLSKKIESLKKQGNTVLNQVFDEDGVELSGGEEQRLAMARALYKNSSMLILDEPTASLSPKVEYDLYQKIENISKNRTTIFISHKLAVCKLCDSILVLDNSELSMFGSHDELMKTDNLYSKMFRIQAESFNI